MVKITVDIVSVSQTFVDTGFLDVVEQPFSLGTCRVSRKDVVPFQYVILKIK